MMKQLPETGHQLDCPCCKRRFAEVFPDQWPHPGGFELRSGQVQAYRELIPNYVEMWDCLILIARCQACDARLMEIDVQPLPPSGEGLPFIATEGGLTWIVTHFAGPVFAHRFGPFHDDPAAWSAPDGPAALPGGGGPWSIARDLVATRWLPQDIGDWRGATASLD